MDKLKKEWKSILSASVFLVVLCIVVTLAVSASHSATEDRIAMQQERARAQAMYSLLPAYRYDEVFMHGASSYMALAEDGEVLGFIFISDTFGWGGPVQVMTAIQDRKVLAIAILDAAGETPGLGQNILRESFTDQFRNIVGTPELVRGAPTEANHIQALTGATASAKAVVDAVTTALEIYEAQSQLGG